MLYCRVTDGAGGYEPGKLIKSYEREIDKRRVNEFLELIHKYTFWDDMPATEVNGGLDGAQWIIEGLSGGRYHLEDRWSPEEGGVWEMGILLLKFSGLRVSEVY